MKSTERTNVRYSYSYVSNEKENSFEFTTAAIGKLPKIKMVLPKISLSFSENLSLAIC